MIDYSCLLCVMTCLKLEVSDKPNDGGEMQHDIASSSAFGARCTCGHIERSTLGRLAALNQLMDHMEAAEKESTIEVGQ